MKKEQKQKKGKVQETEEQLPPDQQARLDLYDWIQSLMVALVICVSLFIFAVRVIDVSGSSMVPTLRDGDKMIVSDLFYKPKYGDIVVFKTDQYDPDRALVKRVIATEGQEISLDFDRGVVYINGSPIEEDYIAELTTTKLDFIGPQTVPEGCVFVMGDNRPVAVDSRSINFGCINTEDMVGKIILRVWPLNEWKFYGL